MRGSRILKKLMKLHEEYGIYVDYAIERLLEDLDEMRKLQLRERDPECKIKTAKNCERLRIIVIGRFIPFLNGHSYLGLGELGGIFGVGKATVGSFERKAFKMLDDLLSVILQEKKDGKRNKERRNK